MPPNQTTDAGGYDWKNGQGGDAETFDPNEYVLAPAVAPRSADEIAEKNGFRNINVPGDYELVLVGFLKRPEVKNVQKHYQGRPVSYLAAGVTIKFADARDRGQTTLLYVLLPPEDPNSLTYYFEAGNATGGGQGFEANQLVYLLNRLGFDWGQGLPMPEGARRLGNWIGRHVVATLDFEKPKKDASPQIDPSTNQPYPPQIKIVPFSFRAVEGATLQPQLPLGGQTSIAGPAQRPAAPAQAQAPAQAPTQPRPAQPAPRQPSPPQGQGRRPQAPAAANSASRTDLASL
jgi:hypothetical protein